MTTEEAVALRQSLEFDLLALLRTYQDATGLAPISVDLQTADITRIGPGSGRGVALLAVRVVVEL